MIPGEFAEGRPFIRAHAFGALLRVPTEVVFRLGAHLGRTVITNEALGFDSPSLFAPDDVELRRDLFGALPAREVRFLLTFRHDDGRVHMGTVEALVVPGRPDESRLGMDILSRWTTVLDGPTSLVLFEPAPDE